MPSELTKWLIGLALVGFIALLAYKSVYDKGYDNALTDIAEEQKIATEQFNKKVKEKQAELDAQSAQLFVREKTLHGLLSRQTRGAYENPAARDVCFDDERLRNVIIPNINAGWN